MIADIVTASRILFSLSLLALSPSSVRFALLYLLCGVTDVLDGFLARRLHTESERGKRFDSIADLFFAAAYVVKILPLLALPAWIWIWTAVIAAGKLPGILQRSRTERKFSIEHSFANKLTGVLIFLLPLTVRWLDETLASAVVCAAATYAAAEEAATWKRSRADDTLSRTDDYEGGKDAD